MKLKIITLFIATVFFTNPTEAGFSKGTGSHGGNAVVCFKKNPEILEKLKIPGQIVSVTIPDKYLPYITSVETLDAYEGRTGYYGEIPKHTLPSLPGESIDHYIERIQNRFSGWHASTGTIVDYVSFLKVGKSKLNYPKPEDGRRMIPKQDISPMLEPPVGCVYSTIAQQTCIGMSCAEKNVLFDDRPEIINRQSLFSKIMLNLHEYTLAALGPTDDTTDIIRSIVAHLPATEISLKKLGEITGNAYAADEKSKFYPSLMSELFRQKNIFKEQYTSNFPEKVEADIQSYFNSQVHLIPDYILTFKWSQGDGLRQLLPYIGCKGVRETIAMWTRYSVSDEVCNTLNTIKSTVSRIKIETRKREAENYRESVRGEWYRQVKRKKEELTYLRLPDGKYEEMIRFLDTTDWSDPSFDTIYDEVFSLNPTEIQFGDGTHRKWNEEK
jgi:hypothetical protein